MPPLGRNELRPNENRKEAIYRVSTAIKTKTIMWIKNIKSFANHLLKNKLYTIVALLGFTISLAFVILLSVYIKHELSVNQSHKNKDRIYRLTNAEDITFAPPVGQWLQDEFPEIESFTRISNSNGVVVDKENTKLKIEFLFADSTFFTIFSFNLLEGTAQTALKTRNSIVLTEEFAKKMFGSESPLHKELVIDGIACVVNGVVEDISKTSNFQKCDAIINFRCMADLWRSPDLLTSLGNSSFGLYLMSKPNANLPAKAPQVLELFKKDYWIYRDGRAKTLDFEPFVDSYLSSSRSRGTEHNSKTLIMVLSAIVTLILLLAIINYMNLTIAQAGMRVKEIAIKKLLGSSRTNLIVQHVLESVTICFVAFLLATICAFWAEPVFNNLLKTNLNLAQETTANRALFSLLLIITVGFISGIIPALVITRLNAVEVIKGSFRRKSKAFYSKILIGFQYTVVIALITSTLFLSKQVAFMQNFSMGFNSTNIVWVDNNLNLNQKEGFRSEMNKIPGVKRVSFVKGSPIDGGNNHSYTYNDIPVSFQVFIVDSLFFPMMDLDITPTGTAYSKDGIWINDITVKQLGLDSLPNSFKSYRGEKPVLGVFNNLHFQSLHSESGLAVIGQLTDDVYPWQILIQLEGEDVFATLENVKKAYTKYTDGMPFDYGFMDQTVQSWYDSERRTMDIVRYFAILSIVISVMGIFAMSMFFNQQKTKEIGIRKVNGATVMEIILMLNKSFVSWVVIAFIIACPISYYAMSQWLQNFAYKTELSWWVFALSGISALLIALITVSWQTFRAARKNPIEALRYE